MRGKGGLIKHACINIISITLDSEVFDRIQELVSDRLFRKCIAILFSKLKLR